MYERLGISEPAAAPPPPPLPAPEPVLEFLPDPPPRPPSPPTVPPSASGPSTLERLADTRVTISLPVLVVALGAIVGGLVVISQIKGGTTPDKARVVSSPKPAPPVFHPPPSNPPPSKAQPPPAFVPPAPSDPPPPPPPPPDPKLTAAEERALRIRKQGGTEESETALARALDWLARHQADTGEWEAMHFERKCPRTGSCQVRDSDDKTVAPGDPLYTPGVTALSLLAFLQAGHTSLEGPYSKTVSLGLAWLIERQNPDGGILEGKRVHFYNHAAATRTLCEAARLTGDSRFRNAAQKAVDYLGKTQYADGGWSYYRDPAEGERNDTSVTGWVALAILSAEKAGLALPQDIKGRILDLFNRRTVGATGEILYSDRDPGAGRRGAGLIGMGLIVRGSFGREDPEIARRAVERLLSTRPDWDAFTESQERSHRREISFNPDQNFAGWYYSTEALFRRGGENWTAWNDTLRDLLIRQQVKEGHSGGSWLAETSYIGREGGRVFSTAISALILGIYARER
jgi:hypothetical protein